MAADLDRIERKLLALLEAAECGVCANRADRSPNCGGRSGRRRGSGRSRRSGSMIGGLVCVLVTPWFALAYFEAYGGIGEAPPPWADWFEWPVLIAGDAVEAYNVYGLIFGVFVLVAVTSLAVLVRRSTVEGSGVRRSWFVILTGLGSVGIGSVLEYGFGSYIDPSFGFFAELVGFLAAIVGSVLLGRSVRAEADIGVVAALGIGVAGLLAVLIGVVLVGHIPSGPALVPLIASVIWGFTGLPETVR